MRGDIIAERCHHKIASVTLLLLQLSLLNLICLLQSSFQSLRSRAADGRRDSSIAWRVFLQLCFKLCQGSTDLTHPHSRIFPLHPRPRDRTPRIVSREDSNTRATPPTRSRCLSAAAALGALAPTTTSLQALVSVLRITTTTTTPTLVVSLYSFLNQATASRGQVSNAPMRHAPRASRGILSNSSFASGFGSNTGNAFGSNNNTGSSMFGGNATSTFGSGGMWVTLRVVVASVFWLSALL